VPVQCAKDAGYRAIESGEIMAEIIELKKLPDEMTDKELVEFLHGELKRVNTELHRSWAKLEAIELTVKYLRQNL